VIPAPIHKSFSEAFETIAKWRADDLSIAFTNGCFDLLHKGHVDYLLKCSQLCDRLILGLNSDISIQKIKGNQRPIQSQKSRAAIMSMIKGVDMVILFDDDTPLALINDVQPKVIVKGGDYKVDEMIGRDIVEGYGGECTIIPFTDGYSTTSIIHKIQQL